MPMTAEPSSIARSKRVIIHGGVQVSTSSGAPATSARLTRRSWYWTSTWRGGPAVAGARRVGRLGQRAPQRLVPDLRVDQQLLPGLEADPRADQQPGVPLQS